MAHVGVQVHLRMKGMSLARQSRWKSKFVDRSFPPPKNILYEYTNFVRIKKYEYFFKANGRNLELMLGKNL